MNKYNLMTDQLKYAMHGGIPFSWVKSRNVQDGAFEHCPQAHWQKHTAA